MCWIDLSAGGLRTGSRSGMAVMHLAQLAQAHEAPHAVSHVHDVIITKEAPNYRLE